MTKYEHTLEGRRSRYRALIDFMRMKEANSTFLERVIFYDEADRKFAHLPQPLCFGEGIYYVLDNLSLPIMDGDLLLGRVQETVPNEEQEAYFQERVKAWGGRSCPPWAQDGSHETLAWERLMSLGLPGLEEHARRCLVQRRTTNGKEIPPPPLCQRGESGDFLEGAIRVYQGFRRYAQRWSEAGCKAGLLEAGERCAKLAENPPETFAEALQLTWLVGLPSMMLSGGSSALTFSRMDDFLLPFYRRDVSEGRLTREDAVVLMDDFLLKIYSLLGIGEHQMGYLGNKPVTGFVRNPCFDSSTYVIVGGRRKDSGPVSNELTEIVLESAEMGLKTPTVILRYTHALPDSLWDRVCSLVQNNTSLFIYNDETMIPALQSWGVRPEDAVEYSFYGCNDPHISGKEGSLVQHWPNLAAIAREVIVQRDAFSNKDELLAAFLRRFRRELNEVVGPYLDRIEANADKNLLRLDDCFLEGPIERACDWMAGGVDYHNCLLQLSGLATAIDSLAAVLYLRFDEQKEEIASALEANFEGYEILQARLAGAPKFGSNETLPDMLAGALVEGICNEIADANQLAKRRYKMIPCISTDMNHIAMGRNTGATPDGRRAGEPISENQSPAPGRANKGLTAMFNSLLHIPFKRITGGPLNVLVHPTLIRGKEELLGKALRTYLDRGGLQVQVSTVDKETLLDAQIHPERYRDLTVRVTGYSAYFVDMSKGAQEEIIRRADE
ncbi:hypothetical protein FJZ31_07460 [Candidatus Poribacteria bacterium]|nr:hypothetical protein [Candidatus Poribacteria bacterium]